MVRKHLSQIALGQLEQRDVWDAESRRSREPIKYFHVSSLQRGTRKPISGSSKDIVPDSTGTVGTKGRVGRKKPGGPRMNQEMPHVLRRG
ncbi:hypothetical protein KI387_016764, partial [Taxus chinensis]